MKNPQNTKFVKNGQNPGGYPEPDGERTEILMSNIGYKNTFG